MLTLDWEAPLTRMVIHIADAPGHGDFETPNSLARKEAEILLKKLKCDINVFKYIFVKTNEKKSLNLMVDAFKVSPILQTQARLTDGPTDVSTDKSSTLWRCEDDTCGNVT